jgi:P4 family phage/plasmid primase-like protien
MSEPSSVKPSEGLSEIGKEAQYCAHNGIRHIPLEYPKQIGCSCEFGSKCENSGKHPLKLNGKTYGSLSAIVDPEESARIWKQQPCANLGILTGPDNDLFVLDIDIDDDKGVDGVAELVKFESEYGTLPESRIVSTGLYDGRRRKRIEFRFPKGYESAKWKKEIAPGIEIRAHPNHYVVAPPSMHPSGVRYEYENPDQPRNYPPSWLIELAEHRQNGMNLVPEYAGPGKRHHTIVSIAGSLRHKNLPLDVGINTCLDYNEKHNNPPKAAYEIERVVKDVYNRYEPGTVPREVRETEDSDLVGDVEIIPPAKKPLSELVFDRNLQHKLCVVTEDKTGNRHVRPVPGQIAKYLQEHYFDFITFRDNEQVYFYDRESGLYVPGGESKIKEATEIIIGDPLTTQTLLQVIEHVKRQTFVDRAIIDAIDLDHVAIGNGVFNTQTRELVPFCPKHVYLSKLPPFYDPEAPADEVEAYMKSTFHADDVPWLQEFYGWHLEPSMRYKKGAMLLGGGDNGKTIFENILMAVFGEENVASVSIQDMKDDKYATAELYQKTANIYDDLPAGRIRDSGQFKILSGDGRARAQEKYQRPFYFWNRAKGTYSANKLPGTRDLSLAFFTRWLIAEMPYRFVERYDIDGHPAKLGKGERPRIEGIVARMTTPAMLSSWLNWMLVGLDRLRQNERFSSSKTQDDIRDIWLMQTSPISMFVKDCLSKVPGKSTEKKAVYNHYLKWCEANEVDAEKEAEFAKSLRPLLGASSVRPRAGGRRPTCWSDFVIIGEESCAVQDSQGTLDDKDDDKDDDSKSTGYHQNETEDVMGIGQGGQGINSTPFAGKEKVHHVEEQCANTLDHLDQTKQRPRIESGHFVKRSDDDILRMFRAEVGTFKICETATRCGLTRETAPAHICKDLADEHSIHLDEILEFWQRVALTDSVINDYFDDIFGGS